MVAALEVLKLRNNDPRLNQTFRDLNLFLAGFTRLFNAGRFFEIVFTDRFGWDIRHAAYFHMQRG